MDVLLVPCMCVCVCLVGCGVGVAHDARLNVLDCNVLKDNRLHFIALVHCELNKFRTTTSATSNCSVQGRSRVVNVNTVVASRQQCYCAHFKSQRYKQGGGRFF